MINTIKLAHGSGGREMGELIKFIRKHISFTGNWECTDEDSAVLKYANQRKCESEFARSKPHEIVKNPKNNFPAGIVPSPLEGDGQGEVYALAFTTDAFVVNPIFFPGGNIGDLAFNGTVNDILMQGAKPLGLSLALVLEEGFSIDELKKILKTIGTLSLTTRIPIVTGDTKVVEKGALDKIIITTAGVGIATTIISDRGLKPGDQIIASGNLGDHGAALLAHRFGYKTNLASDTKPLTREMTAVRKYLTAAKDSTRGGMAAIINEMAEKSRVKIVLDEKRIPISKPAASIANLLGIDKYSLASEGKFIAGVNPKYAKIALDALKHFDKSANIIGKAVNGRGVFLKTALGEKKLNLPQGVLIPRIC